MCIILHYVKAICMRLEYTHTDKQEKADKSQINKYDRVPGLESTKNRVAGRIQLVVI